MKRRKIMIKMIENKNIVAMILFLSLFFYNTLVTAYGGIPESKVTNDIIGTENHHSIGMDQSNNNVTKGVSENVSIITNPSIIIYVNGMVCSFCAQGITKSFKSHNAIKDVSVSLENKTVKLKLKRFHRISDKKIQSIINDSGYNVKEIKR